MNLAEKVLQWAATAVSGFLVATVLQPVSIGKTAFESFSHAARIDVFSPNLIPDQTYSDWGISVISGLIRETLRGGVVLAMFAFAGVFVMAAHVLAREHLDAQDAGLPRPLAEYKRWHRPITGAAFGMLLVLAVLASTPATLAVSYVVLVLPAVLYLGFYISDVYRRRFVDSLVYLWVIACLGVGSVNLPYKYGEIAFDLPLLLEEAGNDPARSGHRVVLEDAPGVSGTLTIGSRLKLRLEQGLVAAASQRASARALASLLPRQAPAGGSPETAYAAGVRQPSVMPDIWVQHAFVLGNTRAQYAPELQPWNQLVASYRRGYFDIPAETALANIEVTRDGQTVLIVGADRRVDEILSMSPSAMTGLGAGVGSPVAAVTEAYGDPHRLTLASCGGRGASDGFWLVYQPGRGGALGPYDSGLRFLACPRANDRRLNVTAISIFVP